MKNLSVSPPVLSTVAGRHSSAAGLIADRAVAERFDAATLAPTFGLIGAPFLAALSAALHARTGRLDDLARAHAGQAANTLTGAAAYAAADTAGGREMRA
ncbi:type VII secretion target [Gordonia sp. PP30]|uniref:type VII secretion target n=1 Tax=unclassified Gordonia (in: high G+C Gram-positive bacteria) TaxID=2657482 RepID=UPI001FFEF8FB|nr:type VII secretion target [Gordonia sp. PP30]UQE76203.1 type VII secretion target [Gordonia sp. PP30]